MTGTDSLIQARWKPCLCCGRLCPFVFCDSICATVGQKR